MDSLSNKHYQIKQIQKVLDIDRNRLFYWTRTHRLLVPEVSQPDGTGSRARFSIKNLLEIAFIKEMVRFGMDLRSIKLIKEQLDQPNRELDGKNIFGYALDARPGKDCWVAVYRREDKKFLIRVGYISPYADADADENGPYPVPGPLDGFLYENAPPTQLQEFVGIRVEIGSLAEDLFSKLGGP